MDKTFDTAYFMRLCKHEDPDVRVAAKRCMDVYFTGQWKSRYKRIMLDELAHALFAYIDRGIKKEKERRKKINENV